MGATCVPFCNTPERCYAVGMVRFAAIDFETANESPASACALGVCVYENGALLDARHWLIRPPAEVGTFRAFNTQIHGIGAADVADAPDFAAVWRDAAAMIGDRPLAAHNAAFDMGVLRALFSRYGIAEDPRSYLCTYLLARRVWPRRPSYSLGVFARELGIVFRHHDALEDARACGGIVLAACSRQGCGSLEELAGHVDLRLGRVGVYPCVTAQSLKNDRIAAGENGVFRGKTIVFTGKLGGMTRAAAARRVAAEGGLVTDRVDAGVDFLVEGTPDPRRLRGNSLSSKSRKVAELAAAGVSIEILAEEDFLALLAAGTDPGREENASTNESPAGR